MAAARVSLLAIVLLRLLATRVSSRAPWRCGWRSTAPRSGHPRHRRRP